MATENQTILISGIRLFWRRRRDSNPRHLAVYMISNHATSAGPGDFSVTNYLFGEPWTLVSATPLQTPNNYIHNVFICKSSSICLIFVWFILMNFFRFCSNAERFLKYMPKMNNRCRISQLFTVHVCDCFYYMYWRSYNPCIFPFRNAFPKVPKDELSWRFWVSFGYSTGNYRKSYVFCGFAACEETNSALIRPPRSF